MTVKEIVKKYLEDNGYDGLWNEYDCACKNDDLMPCGVEDAINCEAGYLTGCPHDCGEHNWHIGRKEKSMVKEK